jgi:hypothetical protein
VPRLPIANPLLDNFGHFDPMNLVNPYAFGAAPAWAPDDEATLRRWILADNLGGSLSDNDPISTATDASGNGNHLTQSGGARPLYKTNIIGSLPGMLFASVSSQYLGGSAVAGTAKTWGIVFRATGPTVALLGTKAGISDYYNFGGDSYTGTFRGARIDPYPTGVPSSGDVILIGVSSASTYEIYLDSTTGEGAQSANFDAGDSFNLGGNGALGVFWNSYIFEYVEFNEEFDSTKRGNLYTYLQRWQ